jgi:hypothetical protein
LQTERERERGGRNAHLHGRTHSGLKAEGKMGAIETHIPFRRGQYMMKDMKREREMLICTCTRISEVTYRKE